MLTSRYDLRCIMCYLLFSLSPVQAEHLPDITPEFIPGVKTLTAELLIELAQSYDDLIVIDSRVRADRAIGYIEESISLPDFETNCTTLNNISSNLNQSLLFYCNSLRCGRSMKAVTMAKSCNYQSLYWLRGGFDEWKVKDYPYMLE